jgi:hypothetical protein
MPRAARTLRICLAAAITLGLAACGGGLGARLGDLEPPPPTLPLPERGAAEALLGGTTTVARDPNEPWGVGMLRPSGRDGAARVELPLFEQPGARHWGWITQGQIYDLQRNRTLPDRGDALVGGSGARGWAVVAADDDWLRIRYGRPGDRDGGLAWTSTDLARGTGAAFAPWDRVFEDARGVVFRSDSAHNLRDGPSTDAAVVERLEGRNFDMTVIEIQGDWMRVRVNWPPACAGSVAEDLLLGGSTSETETGWVTWRSADRGPWVESQAGLRCAGGA